MVYTPLYKKFNYINKGGIYHHLYTGIIDYLMEMKRPKVVLSWVAIVSGVMERKKM